jgi:predicted metal-binding membrane protein
MRGGAVRTGAAVLGAALVAWILAIHQMRGMSMGPGAGFGSLAWFLGVWTTMMAAMMLPSALPMVLLFARVARESARRGRRSAPTAIFVGCYLAVWVGYGIVAYAAVRALRLAPLAWSPHGQVVAGALVALAGVYELTPLKRACLRHCRSPLHYVLGGWRPGVTGAIRMGAGHGAYCVGCCAGLMVVLLALGAMSLFWMTTVAAIVFAQKVLPGGGRSAVVVAAALVALGVSIAL